MRILAVGLLVLLVASPAFAYVVSADADGFGEGGDISAVFTGMTLSSVGGYSGLDGAVYACGDGLASTPTMVFANNLSFERQWYANMADGFALRADFATPAYCTAIDLIGDDYGGDVGVLYAYNAGDVLLDTVTSPLLGYGEVFRAEIFSGSFDIAYIVAGGQASGENTVHLDNLSANIVPEPCTIGLLGLGGLILVGIRRVRRR